jgi:peptidoglycan/LPS O-acetylase OafA/YrhL
VLVAKFKSDSEFNELRQHDPTKLHDMFLKHRNDIDGLRAVAVLPVVLFHYGVGLFRGGFTGVDIFFTISGFVIATSILSDIRSGSFSIANFYFKRIRRILPAYAVVMIATTVVATVLLLPSDLVDYGRSLVSTSTFLSNFYFWKASGYFAAPAQTKPLLHTWSLSVEEQYYLFAPICFWSIYRYGRARWLLFLGPIALLSFLTGVAAVFVAPTAGFFLFPTRAWELLLGAIIALVNIPMEKHRGLSEVVSGAGLVLILFGLFTIEDGDPFPGWNALFPCLGTAMIIQAGIGSERRTGSPLVNRLLCYRPLVNIGLISYSLYLVHWPIAAFVKYETLSGPTVSEMVIMVAATFSLAWLSWRFVEQPCRQLSFDVRGKAFSVAAGFIAFAVLVGASAGWTGGIPLRFPDFAERQIAGVEDWGGDHCFNENPSSPTPWDSQLCTRIHGKNGRILLWGDSFAAHYVPGILRDASRIDADVLQYTFAGCPPLLSYFSYARVGCTKFNKEVLDVIRGQNVDTVVIAARWTDVPLHTLRTLGETLARLRQLGVRIYVIGQSPQFIADVQHIDYISGNYHLPSAAAWKISFNPAINSLIAGQAGDAVMIDPLSFLCEHNSCQYRIGQVFFYADYGHYSRDGSVAAVRAFFPAGQGNPSITAKSNEEPHP